jgi:hypothetical protein
MTRIILEIDSTTVIKATMSTEFDRSMNRALFLSILLLINFSET